MTERRRLAAAAGHATALAIACLISYWLAKDVLTEAHSLSASDDLVGGLWAVIATVFVYRETQRESVSAALNRISATLVSFALCLIYLLLFSFDPVGMAVLIALGTFLLMAAGRDDDVAVTGITTAVVMVAAALNPHAAWEQPILRLVDTAIGVAVALGASFVALQFAQQAAGATARSRRR